MSLEVLNLFSELLSLRTVVPCALAFAIPSVAKVANCAMYHIFRSYDYHKDDISSGRSWTDQTNSPQTPSAKKTVGSFIKYFLPISLPRSISDVSFWSNPSTISPLNTLSDLISSYDENNQFIPPWKQNFYNVYNNRHLIEDPFSADLENLVKNVINTPLQIGDVISLRSKEHSLLNYKIHAKIAAKGLVSYALKPLDNPNAAPLVVFRGTEPDPFGEESFNSLRNDIEKNLGKTGWLCSKKFFDELMKDSSFRSEGQLIDVAGYSLGGAHAQYFIAEHHEAVNQGIFYSNPSIDNATAEKFAESIQNSNRSSQLSLQIFRVLGDPVPHFGGKHLGCGTDHPNLHVQLIELDLPHQLGFDVNLHWKKIFNTQEFDYVAKEYTDPEVLSKKLNNHIRDPISSILESLRSRLSNALHFLIDIGEYSFFKIYHLIKTRFRKHQ